MREEASQFLQTFVEWADRQSDILGVALVGSHARNEATELSDIDLVIITTTPQVEYGFTDENWSAPPIDRGTLSVISDGFQILCDRAAVLGRLRDGSR